MTSELKGLSSDTDGYIFDWKDNCIGKTYNRDHAKIITDAFERDFATRAVPDVPKLVRYGLDKRGFPWIEMERRDDGEYVRYDQAAKVIAAEREKAQVLEQQLQSDDDAYSSGFDAGFGEANMTRNKRAEAAEAKLSEYEKQEPVAWQHAVTYPDGVKYIGVISKESKQQSRPLYASPAPYPDLKAENERLREALEYARGAVNDNERFTDVAQVIDIALSINSPS